jgi:hypothetical protein
MAISIAGMLAVGRCHGDAGSPPSRAWMQQFGPVQSLRGYPRRALNQAEMIERSTAIAHTVAMDF